MYCWDRQPFGAHSKRWEGSRDSLWYLHWLLVMIKNNSLRKQQPSNRELSVVITSAATKVHVSPTLYIGCSHRVGQLWLGSCFPLYLGVWVKEEDPVQNMLFLRQREKRDVRTSHDSEHVCSLWPGSQTLVLKSWRKKKKECMNEWRNWEHVSYLPLGKFACFILLFLPSLKYPKLCQ